MRAISAEFICFSQTASSSALSAQQTSLRSALLIFNLNKFKRKVILINSFAQQILFLITAAQHFLRHTLSARSSSSYCALGCAKRHGLWCAAGWWRWLNLGVVLRESSPPRFSPTDRFYISQTRTAVCLRGRSNYRIYSRSLFAWHQIIADLSCEPCWCRLSLSCCFCWCG